jgi:hypothetical protein
MSCTIVWNDVSDGILNSNKNKNADGLSFSLMNRDMLQIKKIMLKISQPALQKVDEVVIVYKRARFGCENEEKL